MMFRVIFNGNEYVGQHFYKNSWQNAVSSKSHDACLYSLKRITRELESQKEELFEYIDIVGNHHWMTEKEASKHSVRRAKPTPPPNRIQLEDLGAKKEYTVTYYDEGVNCITVKPRQTTLFRRVMAYIWGKIVKFAEWVKP